MSARCRNCGTLQHLTQECTDYGPWYPEPGKSGQDYGDLVAQIDQLVAEDIFKEHEEAHAHE